MSSTLTISRNSHGHINLCIDTGEHGKYEFKITPHDLAMALTGLCEVPMEFKGHRPVKRSESEDAKEEAKA